MPSAPVTRLVPGSTSFNTLNVPPAIPVHFQRSPDFPGGPPRGILGLSFQVLVAGAIVSTGTTADDGKVDVRVPPGGTATVQLLFAKAVVAEYEVSVDNNPLSNLNAGDAILDPGAHPQAQNEATNAVSIRATQERLRMLGYQIGHGGSEGTGVSGVMTTEWERSVLDFQADQNILLDAKIGAAVKTALTNQAGE